MVNLNLSESEFTADLGLDQKSQLFESIPHKPAIIVLIVSEESASARDFN